MKKLVCLSLRDSFPFAKKYSGVLPVLCPQLQADTGHLVFCMKTESAVKFENIIHYESEKIAPKLSAEDILFALTSERCCPEMMHWVDIPWNEIGIIGKDVFHRFVKTLLLRLAPMVMALWKKGGGYASGYGFEQQIVEGTYLSLIPQASIRRCTT